MPKNMHRVPKKQWSKWNRNEQTWFNSFWGLLEPWLLEAIGVEGMRLKKLRMLRWNLCWVLTDHIRHLRLAFGADAPRVCLKQKEDTVMAKKKKKKGC